MSYRKSRPVKYKGHRITVEELPVDAKHRDTGFYFTAKKGRWRELVEAGPLGATTRQKAIEDAKRTIDEEIEENRRFEARE